jgi:hypothetical protein
MKVPIPRFSLRGMLMATFWVAVLFGAGAASRHLHRAQLEYGGTPFDWLETPLMFTIMLAPFIAVGALFDRALWGLVIGGVALLVYMTIFLMS